MGHSRRLLSCATTNQPRGDTRRTSLTLQFPDYGTQYRSSTEFQRTSSQVSLRPSETRAYSDPRRVAGGTRRGVRKIKAGGEGSLSLRRPAGNRSARSATSNRAKGKTDQPRGANRKIKRVKKGSKKYTQCSTHCSSRPAFISLSFEAEQRSRRCDGTRGTPARPHGVARRTKKYAITYSAVLQTSRARCCASTTQQGHE